jgi:hypothetical protein
MEGLGARRIFNWCNGLFFLNYGVFSECEELWLPQVYRDLKAGSEVICAATRSGCGTSA